MKSNSISGSSDVNIKLELPIDLVSSLLGEGLLHASDCRCLDAHSKQKLWHLLLDKSANG